MKYENQDGQIVFRHNGRVLCLFDTCSADMANSRIATNVPMVGSTQKGVDIQMLDGSELWIPADNPEEFLHWLRASQTPDQFYETKKPAQKDGSEDSKAKD